MEFAEVYNTDPRKARKPHKCAGCGGVIAAGEIYAYHHGISDGRGFSKAVCVDCDKMVADYNADHMDPDDMIAVEELNVAMFESNQKALISQWIALKEKRGVDVGQSWRDRLEDAE
jgi:hypothetical protein